MGKYEKKEAKKTRRPLWIPVAIAIVVIAVVLAVLMGSYFANRPGNNPVGMEDNPRREPHGFFTGDQELETEPGNGLQILSAEEQGEFISVTTSYTSFRYPFAFSDLIQIEAKEDNGTETLEFSVVLGDTSEKMFTIRFDDAGAVSLGAMYVALLEEALPLSADVYPVSDSLDDVMKNTFLAAQESFNDVVNALQENENFISGN